MSIGSRSIIRQVIITFIDSYIIITIVVANITSYIGLRHVIGSKR